MKILKIALGLMMACVVVATVASPTLPKPKQTVEPVGMVRNSFTVRDKNGLPVTDMKQQEFRVIEDGKEQQIESFSAGLTERLVLGLLIDASGSRSRQMPGVEREPAKDFFRGIIRGGNLGFVLSFNQGITWDSGLTTQVAGLEAAVDSTQRYRGSSATFEALYAACERAAGEHGRRVLVVITDGVDNDSRRNLDDVIKKALQTSTTLYLIRVPPLDGNKKQGRVGASTAKRLAKATGGYTWLTGSPRAVEDAFHRVAEELRHQYALTYSSATPAREGEFRRVVIETTRKGAQVGAAKGYYAAKEQGTKGR